MGGLRVRAPGPLEDAHRESRQLGQRFRLLLRQPGPLPPVHHAQRAHGTVFAGERQAGHEAQVRAVDDVGVVPQPPVLRGVRDRRGSWRAFQMAAQIVQPVHLRLRKAEAWVRPAKADRTAGDEANGRSRQPRRKPHDVDQLGVGRRRPGAAGRGIDLGGTVVIHAVQHFAAPNPARLQAGAVEPVAVRQGRTALGRAAAAWWDGEQCIAQLTPHLVSAVQAEVRFACSAEL